MLARQGPLRRRWVWMAVLPMGRPYEYVDHKQSHSGTIKWVLISNGINFSEYVSCQYIMTDCQRQYSQQFIQQNDKLAIKNRQNSRHNATATNCVQRKTYPGFDSFICTAMSRMRCIACSTKNHIRQISLTVTTITGPMVHCHRALTV